MGGYLDEDLRGRLDEVLESRRAPTEPELRRLAEEGDACERVLRAELERREAHLDALSADSHAPLADVVEELRAVRDLRVHVRELRELLADLDRRARELRTSWLSGAGSPRPRA